MKQKNLADKIRDFFISRRDGKYTATQVAKTLGEPVDQVASKLKQLVDNGYMGRQENFGARGGFGYYLLPRLVTVDINHFEGDLSLRICESDGTGWSLTEMFEIVEGSDADVDESDLDSLDAGVQLSVGAIEHIVGTAVAHLEDVRYDQVNGLFPMPPIDMVLHCPSCFMQHIDEPEKCPDEGCPHYGTEHTHPDLWQNPPHKSHKCHYCNRIWRPADVETNGVLVTKTHGEKDVTGPWTGLQFIARERKHQTHDRGFTSEHDDKFTSGELGLMAICYILNVCGFDDEVANKVSKEVEAHLGTFPGDGDTDWHFKGNPIDDLAAAGGLIAAEIERWMRLPATCPSADAHEAHYGKDEVPKFPVGTFIHTTERSPESMDFNDGKSPECGWQLPLSDVPVTPEEDEAMNAIVRSEGDK